MYCHPWQLFNCLQQSNCSVAIRLVHKQRICCIAKKKWKANSSWRRARVTLKWARSCNSIPTLQWDHSWVCFQDAISCVTSGQIVPTAQLCRKMCVVFRIITVIVFCWRKQHSWQSWETSDVFLIFKCVKNYNKPCFRPFIRALTCILSTLF